MSYGEYVETMTGEREPPKIEGALLPKTHMLLKNIGEGGFCFVWLSYRFHDSTFWAIKMFHQDERRAGNQERKSMERIGKIEGFIHLEQYFNYNDRVCLVYPLYGKPLCNQNTGDSIVDDFNLTYEIIEAFGEQMRQAVLRLHDKEYIHTDIRPENILVKTPSQQCRSIMQTFLSLNPQQVYLSTKRKTASKMKNILRKMCKKLYKAYDSIEKIEASEDVIDSDTEIVIVDFGNAIHQSKTVSDIQSRYYQCPEVAIGLPYDYTCDLWSVGCVLYELATNKVLFDPNDENGKSHFIRDHLFQIKSLIGDMPISMQQQSPKVRKLFTSDGYILGFEDLYNTAMPSLTELLEEHIMDDNTDKEIMCEQLPDLIKSFLKYNPLER